MDTHQRKEVSNFQMALYQNKAWTTKAISEAEAVHAAAIREAKACCTNIIHNAETTCATTIRKVETACAECTHALQQAHRDSMEGLEREAIEEEQWDHQFFLIACGVALQVCPLEAHGVPTYPLQLLMGNMSLATLLAISPQPSTRMWKLAPANPCPTTIAESAPSLVIKQQCCLPNKEATSPQSGDEETTGTS